MGSADTWIWGVWTALGAGAALSGFGLVQSGVRYAQWKRLRAWHDGDIVQGSEALKVGLSAQVAPEGPSGASKSEEALTGFITGVSKTSLMLNLENEKAQSRHAREDALPSIGTTMVVEVTDETGMFRFEAQILDAGTSPGGAHMVTLSRPFWLARVQRRQHVRASLTIPATFQLASALEVNRAAEKSGGERSVDVRAALPLHGTILELSAGGLRADLGHDLGVEETARLLAKFCTQTVLRVRLPLPLLSDSPLLARVRVCERVARRGGLGLRLACEFLPLSSHEQELLVSHVFRTQREQLKTRRG